MIYNASSPPVLIGRKLQSKSTVKQFDSQETHAQKLHYPRAPLHNEQYSTTQC